MSDTPSDLDSAPFGAMDRSDSASGDAKGSGGRKDWRKKRRSRSRRKPAEDKPTGEAKPAGDRSAGEAKAGATAESPEKSAGEEAPKKANPWAERGERKAAGGGKQQGGRGRGQQRGGGRGRQQGGGGQKPQKSGRPERPERGDRGQRGEKLEPEGKIEGVLLIDKQKQGELRALDKGFLKTNQDVHVPPRLVQKHKLQEGSMIVGPFGRSKGRHKFELLDVETVDGHAPADVPKCKPFKTHTSIAPDFHYNVGDLSGDLSLRIVDLLCPVGRGQRGLLVAPPRSGKTMILQSFAKALEEHFPDIHLMVLLVDERPEEATEWRRMMDPTKVFVSTNDETSKKHTDLCEAVFKRCKRLVELGEEVVLLVDSLTRMGRAYNNVKGTSGKTMSGGIDSRAMEIPKQFFGLARNTETAGSLTILATALIETGSQMDRVIFEEFKGTGNMELVLSRKLADRRIFPAIDIERSGTRKEERLFSLPKLRQMHTLRRVLTRMHFAEAMELLITKLDEVPTNADFLKRFEVDPDA